MKYQKYVKNPSDITDLLKEFLKGEKLTQRDLSEKWDCSPNSVSALINRGNVTIDKLIKIASVHDYKLVIAFDKDIHTIIQDREETTQEPRQVKKVVSKIAKKVNDNSTTYNEVFNKKTKEGFRTIKGQFSMYIIAGAKAIEAENYYYQHYIGMAASYTEEIILLSYLQGQFDVIILPVGSDGIAQL